MRLNELNKGMTAVIDVVEGEGGLRQHMLDMGVIPGVEITFIKFAPMGDPMQFRIHGYELTLRKDEAKKIVVSPAEKKEPSDKRQEKKEQKKRRSIRGLAKKENFTRKDQEIRCLKEQPLPLRWWETRTAERLRCLTG